MWLDITGSWRRIFDFGSSTSVNMFLVPTNGSTIRFALTTSGAGGEQRINGTAALPTGIIGAITTGGFFLLLIVLAVIVAEALRLLKHFARRACALDEQGVTGATTAWIIGGVTGGVVFVLVLALPLILVEGLREVFLSSTWTLTYRRLRAMQLPEPAPAPQVGPQAEQAAA